MSGETFLNPQILRIFALGVAAFVLSSAVGIIFAKFFNLFLPEKKKIKPFIGADGLFMALLD
jgi:oxaloacetate decarboxylase beta subunit